MAVKSGRIGILVGGGPAPGINSVIAAATIRAVLRGYEVLAIHADQIRRFLEPQTD